MRYIGDIHGRDDLYARAIAGCDESIQVGDFGFGFIPDASLKKWPGGPDHRFIRGNHDDPKKAQNHDQHIPSGQANETFFVNGGYSIDQAWRIPGVSWWPDEEYSAQKLADLIGLYSNCRPQRVVTHEAPQSVCVELFSAKYPPGPSRTSLALEEMFKSHQPKEWIFGHWHQRRDKIINGTRFICLEEGGWIDL